MLIDLIILAVGLIIILIAAELFTNSIEYVGDKLNLSKNFTGSVLAAVGTALPESILPIIAILFFRDNAGEEIGIGAILGAPFMLATLAFPLVGFTAFVGYLMKKRSLELNVDMNHLRKDMIFFLVSYAIALLIVPYELKHSKLLADFTAIFLIIVYIAYVILTLTSDSEEMEDAHHLYLTFNKFNANLPLGIFQLIFALVIMIIGAHLFVEGIEKLSNIIGLPPLVFSLLLAPVATELPEKINSVLWILRGKDTLAIGNISGAMVFQSTIPVSIGIFLTDWNIGDLGLISGIFTILAGFIVVILSFFSRKLLTFGLSIGAIFYIIYIILVLKTSNII